MAADPETASSRSTPHRRLQELLDAAADGNATEDDIRRRVANLIESLSEDQPVKLEVSTDTGSIDILVGNVIIETKSNADNLGVAPSWAMRDQHARRQYAASQLQDYVNERYRHATAEDSQFDGFTTNGSSWKLWEVKVGGEQPTQIWTKDLSEESLTNLAETGASRTRIFDDLLNVISKCLRTRPSPPNDLSQLVADLPEAAYELALSMQGQPEFETKRGIWADLMRGAFILTDDDDRDDLRLFATQSVLVDIARKVAQNVASGTVQPNDHDDGAFYSWLFTDGASNELQLRITREVDRYNWRLASSDILKGVYHEFIPRDTRHDFGEYYTPDWLAEAVCEHVLDDQWCANSVARAADSSDDLKGIGILEPSCGSGTFLRAAVNRLTPFAQRQTSDEVEQANIICRLVHGLDIHPVAVELARATMLAALPANPSTGIDAINVHVSDSLRWMQDTEMRLIEDDILISVPNVGDLDQIDILVPNAVVLHNDFSGIIDEVFDYGDNITLLEERLAVRGFQPKDRQAVTALSQTLRRLRYEDRNHVWRWYITNLAESHRLHHRKFDRIIGNPPWITRKDISRGQKERADRHRAESIRLGIWAGGSTFATQNNLASLFAAVATRDYTQPASQWKVGYVLPWSALRSETWKGFRSGQWNDSSSGAHDEWGIDLSEPPWDLKQVSPRPFPQSDACVVFGKEPTAGSQSNQLSSVWETWNVQSEHAIVAWDDIKPTATRERTPGTVNEASPYLDSVKNGATIFPAVLVRVDMETLQSGGHGRLRFDTMMPRNAKTPWSQIPRISATVEEECVRQVVFSSDIAPFHRFRESLALIPPDAALTSDRFERGIAPYALFSRVWNQIDQIWQEHRGPNSPQTLMQRINHLGSLVAQIQSADGHRVVYPKSGSWFFGVAVSRNLIVDNACYYVNVATLQEAHYLCAIFAADELQVAFRNARNTDRHFDTYPLRGVPIPTFNDQIPLHADLAHLGNLAAGVAERTSIYGTTARTRNAIRDALRQDGIMTEINQRAQALLPTYCAQA